METKKSCCRRTYARGTMLTLSLNVVQCHEEQNLRKAIRRRISVPGRSTNSRSSRAGTGIPVSRVFTGSYCTFKLLLLVRLGNPHKDLQLGRNANGTYSCFRHTRIALRGYGKKEHSFKTKRRGESASTRHCQCNGQKITFKLRAH